MMKNVVAFSCFLLMSGMALSQESCAKYPFDEGINVEDVQGGTKILATAQVAVTMDDIDSIKDAREEATIEAKAMISKFLTEDIKSDSKIDKIVNESKQADGQNVQVLRKELITRVKSIRNSSQALLRGVVTLGSCYSKGREFRVTVGLKPETIKSAENIAGGIGRSVASQPTVQSGRPTSGVPQSNQPQQGVPQPLRGSDGHSSTERILKF